jgi:hypothetical protein
VNTDNALKLISHTRKELDDLERALRRATDVQWERAPSDSTSSGDRRARGGHRDPTGDTAVDPQRLTVRRAVTISESELARIYPTLRSLTGQVRHAVGRWEGP